MSGPVWTPLELVRWTTAYFERYAVPTPRLDAELLLAHALGVTRIDLYLRFEETVPESRRAPFRDLVRRRAAERVPVAYLVGEREFWSLPFEVTPETLIPRPDTETLVRAVVELAPRSVADIGTGCGAIALALAKELPEARVVGAELAPGALEVARRNGERLGLAERVEWVLCDALAGLEGPFEAIVSNPPYVPTAELEGLAPELRHEPRVALDGGPDGRRLIGRLVAEAPALLAPDGVLALEVGIGQAAGVATALKRAGANGVETRKDLAGIERVVLGRFGAEGSSRGG